MHTEQLFSCQVKFPAHWTIFLFCKLESFIGFLKLRFLFYRIKQQLNKRRFVVMTQGIHRAYTMDNNSLPCLPVDHYLWIPDTPHNWLTLMASLVLGLLDLYWALSRSFPVVQHDNRRSWGFLASVCGLAHLINITLSCLYPSVSVSLITPIAQRRRTCLSGLTWWCPIRGFMSMVFPDDLSRQELFDLPTFIIFSKVTQRVCEPAGEFIGHLNMMLLSCRRAAQLIHKINTKSHNNLAICMILCCSASTDTSDYMWPHDVHPYYNLWLQTLPESSYTATTLSMLQHGESWSIFW